MGGGMGGGTGGGMGGGTGGTTTSAVGGAIVLTFGRSRLAAAEAYMASQLPNMAAASASAAEELWHAARALPAQVTLPLTRTLTLTLTLTLTQTLTLTLTLTLTPRALCPLRWPLSSAFLPPPPTKRPPTARVQRHTRPRCARA